MAQVVVDSSVMRDKAKTLENEAVTIQSLYAEMLQEVTTTANKMKGTTIETEKKQFANMQNTFDTIVKDIKAYSTFLTQAAETATACAREQSDARIADRIATIEASGTQIVTLSDETRDAMRDAAASVYVAIQDSIDETIYEAYVSK